MSNRPRRRQIFGIYTAQFSRCAACIVCVVLSCIVFAGCGEPRTGDPRTGEPRTGEPRSDEQRSGDPLTGDVPDVARIAVSAAAVSAPSGTKAASTETASAAAAPAAGSDWPGARLTPEASGTGFANPPAQSYLSMEVSPRETPVIHTSIAEALDASRGNGRLALAFFSNRFDTWCKEANRFLVDDAATSRSISSRVNFCFVDIDRRPGDVRKFKVWLPPTAILFDSSGKEVARREGRVDQEEFLSWLRKKLLGDR